MLVNNPPQCFGSNLQVDLIVDDDVDPDLDTEFDAVPVEFVVGLDVVDQLEFIATD